MSGFRFRLATLLRLRENLRDECRQQLAEAQQAEDMIAARLASIADQLADLGMRIQMASRVGLIDVDRLLDAQRFHLVLEAERATMRQQMQTIAAEVERRRLSLVEADREVKVLEKLREKLSQRHQEADAKREMKLLDDRAILQAGSLASHGSHLEQEASI